ncbi:hypothetical protein BGZ58_002591, partial [Dissophora ornata]
MPEKSTTEAHKTTGGAKATTTTAHATRTTTVPKASPTSTSTPAPTSGGGLSTPVIGGIAAGAVVLVALVGLVFYKRRKRAVAKDGFGGGNGKGDEPIYMNPSNYKNKKGPPGSGISGPLALAAENGASSSPFPPPVIPSPQQRGQQPQQNQHPGMKGNGYTVGQKPSYDSQDYYNDDNKKTGGNLGSAGYKHNNASSDSRLPLRQHENDYYDDGLVHDYYSGDPTEPIGAQQSPVQSRDIMSPAPEYYLGKEDIDPRRDLRGLDLPGNYIRD